MFPKAAVIVSIPLIIFLMLVGLVVGDSRIQSDFESQVGPARLSGATNSTSTVTKTTDSNDGVCNTDCSLREAIAVAASGTAIVIPVGTYTLALGSQLTIDRSLTLIGAQASTTIIQAATQPGTASFPVFGISNGDVEISDLTIRHGNATGNGGGISNSANLTLNGVRLTENRATASGGAVANFNTLIVTNSRFRNNHAGIQGGALYNDGFADLNGVTLSANTTDNAGGGIRNVLNRAVTLNNVNISENSASIIGGGIFNDGTVHLSDSVVDGNSSSDGAGLYNNGTLTLINSTVSLNIATSAGGGITNSKPDANVGVLSLMNSTISGNKATGPGGGIVNSGGTSSLTNSTITNNSSDAKGGGVWADTAKLSNTVIADNMAPSAANCFANSQPFTSVGHNLVGDLGGCNYTPGPGDITGIVDAKLGPLQDNGGPTFTHALKPGSPAIDAGDDSAAPNTDQRGVARPQGPASDIGAFERIPEQPPEVDFLPNATTTGDAPLTIQFIDTSAGAPTSWLWNFGDGATSSQRNPSHTYNRGGVFTVGLTAAYGSGTSTIAKFGLVNVT